MSPPDLSDFGVDVDDEPEETSEASDASNTSDTPGYPNGRCPAINTGDRQRCRSAVSRMKDADGFCGTHGRARDPWTIDDSPRWLVKVTGSRAARCRALKLGGDRCTNACGPLEHFCGTHDDWPHDTVDELEDGEIDVDRIREAISAIEGAET